MAKFCTGCGAELPEDGISCPNCGIIRVEGEYTLDPVQSQQEPLQETAAPAPTPKKKGNWWLIPVAAVVVVAIAVAIFWHPLMMALAPEMVLTSAMQKTASALHQRFGDSPLTLMKDTVDYDQSYRTDLKLAIGSQYESYGIDLSIHSDPVIKRNLLNGSLQQQYVGGPNEEIGFHVYMDSDAMAVAVDTFHQGKYLGMEYATFREDVLKSALGDILRQEPEMLDSLEQVVDGIDRVLSSDSDMQALLEPYEAVLAEFVAGLEMTTGEVEIQHNGKQYPCETISMGISKTELLSLIRSLAGELKKDADMKEAYLSMGSLSQENPEQLEEYWNDFLTDLDEELDELEDFLQEANITAVYYLYEEYMIRNDLCILTQTENGKTDYELIASYGPNPSRDDLIITVTQPGNCQRETVFALRSKLGSKKGNYVHTLELDTQDADGYPINLVLDTQWDLSSGNLELSGSVKYRKPQYLSGMGSHTAYVFVTEPFDLDMNLQKLTVDGKPGYALSFETEVPYGDLFGQLYTETLKISVNLECCQAGPVEKPDYIPLKEWDDSILSQLEELVGYSDVPCEDTWIIY